MKLAKNVSNGTSGTVYGFNTKPRRQSFLCLWLLLTSIFGFIMIMATNNKSNNMTFYAISLLVQQIGTFLMMCSAMLQRQGLCFNCFFALIMCAGSVLIGYASFQWIDQNCDHNIWSTCAAVHFGFDFIPLGIAFIISLDAISHVLDKKRTRILFYSCIIFVSCSLQSIHFLQIPQNDKTLALNINHWSILIMAIISCLIFIFVGLFGLTQNILCRSCSWLSSIIFHLFALIMLVSGTWVIAREHPNLTMMTMCFFIAHNALRWGITFCIAVDMKHLGIDIIVTELSDVDGYTTNHEELMHIRTPDNSMKNSNISRITNQRGRHDFTRIDEWDLESCTDTATELTLSDISVSDFDS